MIEHVQLQSVDAVDVTILVDNSIDILLPFRRIPESFLNDIPDVAQVLTAGKLRNNSAETLVNFDLGGNNVGENSMSVLHQSGGRFIA